MCEKYNRQRPAEARFAVFEGLMKENAQLMQSLLDEGAKIIDHKVAHSGNGAKDNYAVSVLYIPNYFTVEEYEATSSETAETTDGAPTAEPDVTADAALVTTAESEDVAKNAIDGLQKQADEVEERR